MNDKAVEICADGVDTDQLMAEILAAVESKKQAGAYNDPRIARAERMNLSNIKNDEQFIKLYMECLKDSVYVDINDFDIIEKRSSCAGLLVSFKKLIWKLLKFYTYRLWSQQNQVNGMLLGAFETIENRYSTRIKELETRLAKLEEKSSRD